MADEDGLKAVEFRPIGTIHTPFKERKGMPIQPPGAGRAEGVVEVNEEYREGVADLEGFSHVILIYHFHKAGKASMKVIPFMDKEERGLFATRAPARPNPIGLSIVELKKVEGNRLTVSGIDVLDGTPLLDIKPYVPEFDHRENARTGWLEAVSHRVGKTRSDDRFGNTL